MLKMGQSRVWLYCAIRTADPYEGNAQRTYSARESGGTAMAWNI
jgi:hypothetical protein